MTDTWTLTPENGKNRNRNRYSSNNNNNNNNIYNNVKQQENVKNNNNNNSRIVGSKRRKQIGQPCKQAYLLLFFVIMFVILFYLHIVQNFSRNISKGSAYIGQEFDANVNSYKRNYTKYVAPAAPLAWAIPVGGKTQRLHLLKRLLESLLIQNVNPADIFVFEDDTSRPKSFFASKTFSKNPQEELENLCKLYKVHLLKSHVVRNRKEKRNEFGLFLARHYHFMLDTLLYDRKSKPTYTVSLKNKYLFGHGDPRQKEYDENINSKYINYYEYVVILEDDLELANDAVNFFNSMSWPMSKDKSIFCACAHQDNAYHALSTEKLRNRNNQNKLLSDEPQFLFRRGEHFMAPGWMTSKTTYNNIIRPTWFDIHGELLPWARKRLYNGNWDTYLDFRVEGMECIYPTIPSIAHRGAQGYTVRKDRQDAVFGSLRLSKGDSSIKTGLAYKKEAMNLIHYTYDDNIYKFIKTARVVTCLEEIENNIRNTNVVYHLVATSKKDRQWALLFTGKLGAISVGGHTARMRGIHSGTVFIHYMSNLILVVATYSPYSNAVSMKKENDNNYIIPNFLGCYKDSLSNRDLPVVKEITGMVRGKIPIASETCSCECKGFKYFGLQNGGECFCGNSFGRHGVDTDNICKKKCLSNDDDDDTKIFCGGPLSNAIYDRTMTFQREEKNIEAKKLANNEPIIVSNLGESCTDACIRTNGICYDDLLPRLLFTGVDELLQKKLNCKINMIKDGSSTKYRNVAPALHMHNGVNICYTTIVRHLMCKAKIGNVQRLCVCAIGSSSEK